MKNNGKKTQLPRTEQQLADGVNILKAHPFFGKLDSYLYEFQSRGNMARDSAVVVSSAGTIYVNKKADYQPAQWAWALAHAMLHRAFGHFDMEKVPGFERTDGAGKVQKVADFDLDLWNTACDLYVNKFLEDIRFGQRLREPSDPGVPASRMGDEQVIYAYLKEQNWPARDHSAGTASEGSRDMEGLDKPLTYDPNSTSWRRWSRSSHNIYAADFARTLSRSVTHVVSLAAGYEGEEGKEATPAQKAAYWFLNHYPLFGGMVASFQLREDLQLCRGNDIQVAAVDPEAGEIYINPAGGLGEEEWKFVLAHEFLHVGLQHHKRAGGRDPYLWNVACDYVINGWLKEMQVGQMPEGVLFDPAFKDHSAEEIYDIIIREARNYRKVNTFRGYGKGDVLSGAGRLADRARGVSLDDFFRNALMAGLEYQLESPGRGTIPAGMIQEIRALAMPPIRWDVKLANWFDEHILPLDKHRSYAHPSRRQASTPGIPRPRYIRTERERMAATFGVVIDTSGSMSAEMIGKALGSIASYAAAKDVPAVRVVFCDAEAYDAGYIETDLIAGRIKVVGRGGTCLQPGVDLLEKAKDFPKDGPILLITDGMIEDRMQIRREHAFLIPRGRSLPFKAAGKVFYFD